MVVSTVMAELWMRMSLLALRSVALVPICAVMPCSSHTTRSPSAVAVRAWALPGTNTDMAKSPTGCLKSFERRGGE